MAIYITLLMDSTDGLLDPSSCTQPPPLKLSDADRASAMPVLQDPQRLQPCGMKAHIPGGPVDPRCTSFARQVGIRSNTLNLPLDAHEVDQAADLWLFDQNKRFPSTREL